MTSTRIALTAALVTTLGVASPALAQDKRDAKARESARAAEPGAQKGQKAEARREQPQREQPQREQPQREQPQRQQPQQQPQAQPQNESRRDWASRDNARRNEDARRNDDGRRGNSNVVGESRPRSVPYRSDESIRAEKRNDALRYERRDSYVRGDRYAHYDYRIYGGRTYYRPYAFRPHLSIAFGIFAGYPVPYSYRYDYPIAIYGYRAPHGPVYVGAGSSLYGGVALEIAPYDADVFVDGSFAGKVQDFDGTYQPLTLVYGTHRIEVQAPGLVPLVFDVTVQPGQVIPYRGELRPY